VPLTFSYRVPATRLILGLLFCLAFAIGMGYVALANREGLILLRVLTFSANGATVIYWSFAALLLVAAAMFCVLLARTWKGAVSIVVDDTKIIAPAASLKGELLSIPFSTISGLGAHTIQGQEFVTINSSVGQARVMSAGFRNAGEFQKFKRALAERAKR
jgi:hypothetical protein